MSTVKCTPVHAYFILFSSENGLKAIFYCDMLIVWSYSINKICTQHDFNNRQWPLQSYTDHFSHKQKQNHFVSSFEKLLSSFLSSNVSACLLFIQSGIFPYLSFFKLLISIQNGFLLMPMCKMQLNNRAMNPKWQHLLLHIFEHRFLVLYLYYYLYQDFQLINIR